MSADQDGNAGRATNTSASRPLPAGVTHGANGDHEADIALNASLGVPPLESILESMTDAFFVLDRSWRFVYVNHAAEQVLQRSRQELVGGNVWDLFPEAVGTTFDRAYHRALAEHAPAMFEEYYPPLSIWLDVRAYPSEQGLAVYFRDITAQREAANERERIARELQERAEEQSTLLSVLPVGIVTAHSVDCSVMSINSYFARLLNLPMETDLSREDRMKLTSSVRYLRDGHVIDEREMPVHVAAREAREVEAAEFTIERIADGAKFDLLGLAAPLFTPDGQVRGAVGAFVDVTVRKRQEERLASLLSAEQQARAAAEAARAELQAVLDVLPVSVIIANASGAVTHFNPAGRRIWGRTAPMVESVERYDVYQGWWLESGEPLRPQDWAVARALATGEIASDEELRIRSFDGMDKLIRHSGAPIRDSNGKIVGAVSVALEITEQKRLEAALRESEQRATTQAHWLATVFDAMADGIIVYDTEARILRSNAAIRHMLGWAADPTYPDVNLEERSRRLRILDTNGQPFPTDRLPPKRALRGEVLTGSRAEDLLLHTADGREVLVSVSAAPVHDSAGQIVGAVAVYRDNAERRRMERAVEMHARELDTVIETITDGVAVFRPDGHLARMNAAGRALVGSDVDPAYETRSLDDRGQSLAPRNIVTGEPLSPEEWPPARILAGEVLTGHNVVDVSMNMLDGRTRILNYSGAPLVDEQGAIAGAVITFRDVTERRELEARTTRSLEALLQLAETLVRMDGDGAPISWSDQKDGAPRGQRENAGQRLVDLTLRVLGCSRVTVATFDAATEQTHALAVAGLSPDEERAWWKRTLESEAAGRRLSEALGSDVVNRLHAGEVVTVDLAKLPATPQSNQSPGGNILAAPMRVGDRLVGLLVLDYLGEHLYTEAEITLSEAIAKLAALVVERERLLAEREEARSQALAFAEANRRMDVFLGIAGHELKTPLTTLKASLQFVSRRFGIDEKGNHPSMSAATGADAERALRALYQTRPLVERSQRSVIRLEHLIDDLLDVVRAEEGRLDLRPDVVDLGTLVREAVEEQRQLRPMRSIPLHMPTRASSALRVWADADRLGQVLTNFLNNALKYSPEETPVNVSVRAEGGRARVSVRDQGLGVPKSEQKRIWERFNRVEGVEVQSGSGIGLGLGLYISRTILEQHGAEYGVESEPGAGATFWFALPLLAPEGATGSGESGGKGE